MPSARGDRYHAFPLSGAPAERICRLMGWEGDGAAYWTLIEHFQTANAQERHGPWDLAAARGRVAGLMFDLIRSREPGAPIVIVALGARPAEALAPEGVTMVEGEWLAREGIHAVRLPHTSGRNRAWNVPGTAAWFRETLTQALERAGA